MTRSTGGKELSLIREKSELGNQMNYTLKKIDRLFIDLESDIERYNLVLDKLAEIVQVQKNIEIEKGHARLRKTKYTKN